MLNATFPLFDLKIVNEYVLVAGGGGDKAYGRENGVIAYDKKSLVDKSNKKLAFYQTHDSIQSIVVCENMSEEHLIIGACGTENFYLLEFNNEFKLLKKISKQISNFIYTKGKLIFNDGTKQGIENIVDMLKPKNEDSSSE